VDFRHSTALFNSAILSGLIEDFSLQEVAPGMPSTQRRRSERVSKSVVIVVRGVDLLGQPFEERTSTLNINLHGCRYSSRHHLAKNSWVTVELPERDRESQGVRARVAAMQRPQSIRDFFQISIEFENPIDSWDIEVPPAGWHAAAASAVTQETSDQIGSSPSPETAREAEMSSATTNRFAEETRVHMTNSDSAGTARAPIVAQSTSAETTPVTESPLLREWKADFERQLNEAVGTASAQAIERVRRTVEDFERNQSEAREEISGRLDARQQEFLTGLKSEFERGLEQARELLLDLDRTAQALRVENDAAVESTSRLAQARLQVEADEAARLQQPGQPGKDAALDLEIATAAWRQHLESEQQVAQSQWTELLQSSIDGGIDRLVKQLSGRLQEVLQSAEQTMSQRLTELWQPLVPISSEVKASLEREVSHARVSLGDIEQAATRIRDYAAQIESASHETLNELHRRLENMLETQTDEMKRRAEALANSVPQQVEPMLETLGRQLVERTIGEVEGKIAPRIERIPELLRELAGREVEAEEGLRLHRERLRQIAENSQREIAAQLGSTHSSVREDFEAARKDALVKWNEELDAAGVRAAHAATETIGRSSEWFQEEARVRARVLIEQSLAGAEGSFAEKMADAMHGFEGKLEEESASHLAEIRQRLDGMAEEVAGDIAAKSRTRLDEAAEAAAASFGHVVRGISEREVQQFTEGTRVAFQEREQSLEVVTQDLLRKFDSNAGAALSQFDAQMASRLEHSLAEGQRAMAAESEVALERHRTERDAHINEWTEKLKQSSGEASDEFQDRLRATSDAWVATSSRQLYDHGQNVIESLMRSADQALRASCSKLFEGLSEILRETATAGSGVVAGFTPRPAHEPAEPPASTQ
jgi:hypothetical protein